MICGLVEEAKKELFTELMMEVLRVAGRGCRVSGVRLGFCSSSSVSGLGLGFGRQGASPCACGRHCRAWVLIGGQLLGSGINCASLESIA
jgi:hypothetical protein